MNSILFDYINPNNTVIVYQDSICKENDLNTTLLKELATKSNFDWFDVVDETSLLPLLLTLLEKKSILSILYLSNYSIPKEMQSLFNWISPFTNPNCNLCSIQSIEEILEKWSHHQYISFKTIKPEPLRGTDGEDTFTGITMRIRIPSIIHQTMNSIPSITEEGKNVYCQLADAIRDNQEVIDYYPHPSNDLSILFQVQYNRYQKDHSTWHSIPWWFAENFEFLCLNHIQEETKTKEQSYDPFYYLKEQSLQSALPIFPSLAKPILQEIHQSNKCSYELFYKVMLCLLWGNKADLSMSSGQIEKTSFQQEQSNVLLVNEIEDCWKYLQERKEIKEITICADNVGLELLSDFLLITLLLTFYPSIHIHYIVKDQPVFVSDVTLSAIQPTLTALINTQDDDLIWMVHVLQEAEQKQQLDYLPSLFLCSALAGWEMPFSYLSLLQKQSLFIAKGDANYRRLVGDLHWPYDTSKQQVLNYYPCPLLLLRTLKSNVNIGIPKELQEKASSIDSSWDCSGKMGIIQFYIPSHSMNQI